MPTTTGGHACGCGVCFPDTASAPPRCTCFDVTGTLDDGEHFDTCPRADLGRPVIGNFIFAERGAPPRAEGPEGPYTFADNVFEGPAERSFLATPVTTAGPYCTDCGHHECVHGDAGCVAAGCQCSKFASPVTTGAQDDRCWTVLIYGGVEGYQCSRKAGHDGPHFDGPKDAFFPDDPPASPVATTGGEAATAPDPAGAAGEEETWRHRPMLDRVGDSLASWGCYSDEVEQYREELASLRARLAESEEKEQELRGRMKRLADTHSFTGLTSDSLDHNDWREELLARLDFAHAALTPPSCQR